jgi:hypothetical protein
MDYELESHLEAPQSLQYHLGSDSLVELRWIEQRESLFRIPDL